MSISSDIVSVKFCGECGDFGFENVSFMFLDGEILALRPIDFVFLNSSDLLKHLAMLLTSTLAMNCLHRNFLKKAIRIITLANILLNFIAIIVVWCLSTMSDLWYSGSGVILLILAPFLTWVFFVPGVFCARVLWAFGVWINCCTILG